MAWWPPVKCRIYVSFYFLGYEPCCDGHIGKSEAPTRWYQIILLEFRWWRKDQYILKNMGTWSLHYCCTIGTLTPTRYLLCLLMLITLMTSNSTGWLDIISIHLRVPIIQLLLVDLLNIWIYIFILFILEFEALAIVSKLRRFLYTAFISWLAPYCTLILLDGTDYPFCFLRNLDEFE